MLNRERRIGWIVFAAILAIRVHDRATSFRNGPVAIAGLEQLDGTVGELSHVSLANPIWFTGVAGLFCSCRFFWPKRDEALRGF